MSRRKSAIVTGGAQGIGRGIAEALLAEGFSVVAADIDAEAGEGFLAETANDALHFVQVDVANEEEVVALMDKAVATCGGLDLLVNNAGIMIRKPVEDLSFDEWKRVIDINLSGPFLCSKHASSHLMKTKGSIVNIASTRAFMSEPHTESYSASKGGLVALTHALAASLGPEIRVNCISPGWIDVSGWKKQSERKQEFLTEADHRQHFAGRVGMPEDVATMVVYLASAGAGFVTGANFTIDGGMTRKMIYD